jgi:thioesterase domain-containing protein
LAAGYADAVLSSQPHGPHLLVGDCVGGILAYEIARQLSFSSSRVALVLLDTRYPDRSYKQYLMANFPDVNETVSVAAFSLMANSPDVRHAHSGVAALARAARQSLTYYRSISINAVHIPQYVIKKIPSVVRRLRYFREKMQLLALILKYEPHPYKGMLSILFTESKFAAGSARAWEKVAINGLVSHQIPGGHGSYLRESVGIVSDIVREIALSNEAQPQTQKR